MLQHQCGHFWVKILLLRVRQLILRAFDQVPEMRQAKAFALCKGIAKFTVFAVQVKKGVQIPLIDLVKVAAYIAGAS